MVESNKSTPLWVMRMIVWVQVGVSCGIVFTGPMWSSSWILRAVLFSSALLMGWGIKSLGLGRFYILPIPSRHGRLIRTGPYRLIRHPMYVSVLLFMFTLILIEPTWLRGSLGAILLAVLLFKIEIEERAMRARYPEYTEYAGKTWRLAPWIY